MSEPGTRNHFNGCGIEIVPTLVLLDVDLLDAHLLFGPLTPTPQRSLADVVAEIAGEGQ